MLPAAARVRTPAEHREVARRGVRGRSGPLTVRLLRTAAAPARAGVVVPTTVGNAVTRNRVKRRLRSLLAAELPGLPDGSAVVVRADGPQAALPSRELAGHLHTALAAATRDRRR